MSNDDPCPESANLVPSGWREAVISVRDLEDWTAFFQDTLKWEIRQEGEVSRDVLTAWGLPGTASAIFALAAEIGSHTGFVRIIEFQGIDRSRIRDQDQCWDSGGIFNINFRVKDMASIAKKLADAGWQAPSPPVQFSFGPVEVVEWLPRHADGVRFAFVQRVAPPLTDWPEITVASRAYNSSQVVTDMQDSMKFYGEVLRLKTALEHRSASSKPGVSLLGLSREAMMSIVRDAKIMSPTGVNDGSLEVLKFEGYSGRDFSERAVPPNLGVLMLRYGVPSVVALARHFENSGVSLQFAPTNTTHFPYGAVNTIAVRSPDGAWLEFFEEPD